MNFYSHFDADGYRLVVSIPSSDNDPLAFEVKVLISGATKCVLYVPIIHPPLFGVDVDDVQRINAFAEELIKLLPPAGEFSDEARKALHVLEAKRGGDKIRSAIERGQPRTGHVPFEYTYEAFVEIIAPFFGDRGRAEQWMKTCATDLDNKTPDQALRMGMTREVVQFLSFTIEVLLSGK